jgi:hypothetical protein
MDIVVQREWQIIFSDMAPSRHLSTWWLLNRAKKNLCCLVISKQLGDLRPQHTKILRLLKRSIDGRAFLIEERLVVDFSRRLSF